MADWLTITIYESGLNQRVRAASITAYGELDGICYVILNGKMVNVRQGFPDLMDALEENP